MINSLREHRDHVAIMNPTWQLIPKILSGEKSIESRWYQTRRAPWNKISVGDRIFFKDSGKPITATAEVAEVMQFEIASLTDVKLLVDKFGKAICIINSDPKTWGKLPKYCILIHLKYPKLVKPFSINKKGFGAGVAWISVPNIKSITV